MNMTPEETAEHVRQFLNERWEEVGTDHSELLESELRLNDLITLIDTQAAELAEAKAEAWDEGYDAGLTYMTITPVGEEEPDNPYAANL